MFTYSPVSWEGILDGTKMSNTPVQTESMSKPFADQWPFVNDFNEEWDVKGEDCLYLNVFTSSITPKTKLPVIKFRLFTVVFINF